MAWPLDSLQPASRLANPELSAARCCPLLGCEKWASQPDPTQNLVEKSGCDFPLSFPSFLSPTILPPSKKTILSSANPRNNRFLFLNSVSFYGPTGRCTGVTPGSALRNHSWGCLGGTIWGARIEPGRPVQGKRLNACTSAYARKVDVLALCAPHANKRNSLHPFPPFVLPFSSQGRVFPGSGASK